VTNHFHLPEKIKTGKHSYKYRDDETIMSYYATLANETDSVKKIWVTTSWGFVTRTRTTTTTP
jgi:hypothetical protein